MLFGVKYCCAINCSNNENMIDSRTGQAMHMHGFPSATKEKREVYDAYWSARALINTILLSSNLTLIYVNGITVNIYYFTVKF